MSVSSLVNQPRFIQQCKQQYPHLFDGVLHPDLVQNQTDKEGFLERRKKYLITASDAGVLANVAQHISVKKLIEIKRGEAERPPVSEYAQINFCNPGIEAEERIKAEMTTWLGSCRGTSSALIDTGTYRLPITKVAVSFEGGEYTTRKTETATLGASPDALLFVDLGHAIVPIVVEIKYFPSKEEVLPLFTKHWAQIQQQLQCMDCDYAIWIGQSPSGHTRTALIGRHHRYWMQYYMPRVNQMANCVETGERYLHPCNALSAEGTVQDYLEQSIYQTHEGPIPQGLAAHFEYLYNLVKPC